MADIRFGNQRNFQISFLAESRDILNSIETVLCQHQQRLISLLVKRFFGKFCIYNEGYEAWLHSLSIYFHTLPSSGVTLRKMARVSAVMIIMICWIMNHIMN